MPSANKPSFRARGEPARPPSSRCGPSLSASAAGGFRVGVAFAKGVLQSHAQGLVGWRCSQRLEPVDHHHHRLKASRFHRHRQRRLPVRRHVQHVRPVLDHVLHTPGLPSAQAQCSGTSPPASRALKSAPGARCSTARGQPEALIICWSCQGVMGDA